MIVGRLTQNADDIPREYSSSRSPAEPQAQSPQNDEGNQESPNTSMQNPEDLNNQVEAAGERNDLNSSVNEEQTQNQEPVGLLPTTNTQCEKSHN